MVSYIWALKLSFNLCAVLSHSSRRDTIWLLKGSMAIRFGDGTSFINICAARIFSRCGFFVRLLALRLFCRRRDFTVGPLVSDTRLQRRCDTRRNLASKVTSFDPAGTFTRDYISNRTVQHGGTDFKSLTLALPAVILCTTSE